MKKYNFNAVFMAFGKCAGAFWYFGHHMTPP